MAPGSGTALAYDGGGRRRGVAAVDVPLTARELARIDDVAPKGVAAGTRYAEGGMRFLEA